MKTSCVDDVDFIRARQAEIEAERHRNTDASAAGHMPEDDWATLKAQHCPAVAAITDDLGESMWPIGVRRETLRGRLAELGVRLPIAGPRE